MIDVGFLVIAANQEAKLRPFARDARLAEKHLDRWDDRERSFLTIGQLYYRAEQVRWLRSRASRAEQAPYDRSDAALCAALYRAGGLDTLRRIEGEFAVVGVDRRAKRLIVLRDPIGSYPCFWAATAGRLLVATTLRAFADHLPALEVDADYLADFFASSHVSYAELPTERTVYRQINRLLPGWCLDVDLRSGEVGRRRYWEWRPPRPAAPVASLSEAAPLVRQALETSVAERLDRARRTASHFSGGFDSTGLALLANRLLSARGEELDALTLVYPKDPVQARESEYVAAALLGRDGVRHHRCPADNLVEFAGHERMPLVDEPSPMVADFARIDVLLEAARRMDVDSVLAGDGGDILFHHSPALMVARLLRRGRLLRALELARDTAFARSETSGDILWQACRLAAPGFRGHRREVLPPSLRWLAPDFVDQYRVAERMHSWELHRDPGFFALERVPHLAGDWYHWNLAVPRGIVQTRPFFDSRLLALVAALPPDIVLVPEPMKPLLGAALDDLLPEKIVNRPRKGHFNVVLSGFAVHAQWLRQVIFKAPDDDGVIDREVLSEAVELAGMGMLEDAPAANRLTTAISFLTWSANRAAWRSQQIPYLPGPTTPPYRGFTGRYRCRQPSPGP